MLKKTNKKRGRHSSGQYKKTVTRKKYNKKQKRKLNKKKVAVVLFLILIIIFMTKRQKNKKAIETYTEKEANEFSETSKLEPDVETHSQETESENKKKEISDWRLTLANYENLLPENFTVKVSDIDKTRQFDSRAIGELNSMMNSMKKDGITNIWIQSAYRSVERQKELYDNSVQKYLKQGKTQEEAEKLTEEYINKPGSSDHNLGLAVDFNYVDNKFEKLDGFKWLQKNAENYGFILRYPEDKEDITKISYESWHWRYVGVEHAKKMNKLNMCLEEYVEYLKNNC